MRRGEFGVEEEVASTGSEFHEAIGTVGKPIPRALFYVDPGWFRLMAVKLAGIQQA